MSIRRNLIVACVGDSSLHASWLDVGQAERDADLCCIYFGDMRGKYAAECDFYFERKGTKWELLSWLLDTHGDLVRSYEYIWLPDDDLASDPETTERLFRAARTFAFAVCQPALTWSSFVSHAITLRVPFSSAREVNFVEVMAPLFERDVLLTLADTFTLTRSGWGIDFVWAQRTREDLSRTLGIIDQCAVRHTRAIRTSGGAYRALGLTPADDLRAVLESHRIDATLRVHAAWIQSVRIPGGAFRLIPEPLIKRLHWGLSKILRRFV